MSVLTKLSRIVAVTSIALSLTVIAHAACLSNDAVEKLVAGFPTTPVKGIPANLSLDDAYCTQAKYVAMLEENKKMGSPVGYKVGFTGKATQERFNIPGPAIGVLFEPMFIKDGGSIKRDFGHRTIIEPDLMVVVKDEGIMDVTTELEVAAHLDTVHAYMELAALQFDKGEKLTGAGLVALNIVATKMVQGTGLKVQATPEFVKAMAEMETVLTDEKGEVIQSEPGSNLLGNPLQVVLWLVKEMKRQGKTLKAGDRLSLGSVGKLFPLKEGGKTYTYRLKGLPGGPVSTSVTVQ